jgi:hypothetical protein
VRHDGRQEIALHSALQCGTLEHLKRGCALSSFEGWVGTLGCARSLRMNSASATALPMSTLDDDAWAVHDVRQWRERFHQAQQGVG